jgi:hypothetical protein
LGKVEGQIIVSDYGSILDGANIARPVWFNSEEVEDHLDELSDILEDATKIITDAAFQLLFLDRTFLFEFSKFIRPYILQLQPSEHPSIRVPGVVSRSAFPSWLKNAIFYRDKGRC